jgi:Xaa-Pro aminopeptidase
VRYLTGFTGSNGLALVGSSDLELRVFVTDFRYLTQAAGQVEPGFERRSASTELLDALPGLLSPARLGRRPLRVGFDDAHLSVKQHERLAGSLPEGVDLVPAAGMVERMREVKAPVELERIRAAAALADEVLERALEGRLSGRTERELALSLEYELRREGAHAPSFPSIVASGEHSALPHAEPRDVEIARGVLVTIDMGAELDGYCSDCTRAVATGDPGAQAREVYELVLRAQLAGLEALRPGPSGRDVDAVARAVIEDAGHGEHFGHGLGHGVGMEVHEGPRLSRLRAGSALAAGNVVTVEPGVYLPGRFGVRIEDLVAVTEDGREVLTRVPKELREVG